ncbi:hypothetical protein [Bradyrhizobium lablabi]|uniref:hypothetical protein n=1 Tax=Bradyrhizobium lablabi TaxID=722472 RepID=UPI001BA4895A|nr:hypothetical protein [Bradyrhizobium lablabi]MBR0693473.1 hypothetical protein [Bradyrhizobium lablabi]
MDPEHETDEGMVVALRRSYARLAWWIVRLNRMLELPRVAEPPRSQRPPRIAVPPRQPLPPRPE